MSVITTGELQELYWIGETVYGTTPATALIWGCDLISAKDDTDTQRAFNMISGSRAFGSTTRGMIKCGFTTKGYARLVSGAYDWTKFFALNALGALAAVTDRLPSFSSQVSIKQTALGGAITYQYFLYNGCKLSKLVLSGDNVGQPIVWDATVMARWVTYSATKGFTGLQTVTVGADPADPNTATPVCWTTPHQYNLNGAGYVTTLRPRSWKLTIDNHCVPMPGQVLGADAIYYEVAQTIEEENRDIILEVTLPAQDQTFETAKRLGQVMTGFKIQVDAKVITLGTGYFEENDFPTYKQGLNDETFKIRFQTITIA
jgi:hypothetical protein